MLCRSRNALARSCRLHPFFDTLEFRICDAQSRGGDTIALAALMQAIVVKLHKLLRQNVSFRMYPRRLIDENRWRASRYGLDGKLIDFGRKCEVDERWSLRPPDGTKSAIGRRFFGKLG
jgi:carboxylate-amine ligase